MLDNKRTTPLLALLGAMALMAATPAFAQDAPKTDAAAAAAPASTPAAAPAEATAPAAADANTGAPPQMKNAGGKLTPVAMFLEATPVVKVVMIGLLLASVFSWTLLITKLFEFGGLNRETDKFLEAFRGSKSIADIARVSMSEEFEGNPMADMAAAAS
ncbi:MAG: exbB, partial [Caulobacter sp.]|nr:exbB [Caulobacter sp.]